MKTLMTTAALVAGLGGASFAQVATEEPAQAQEPMQDQEPMPETAEETAAEPAPALEPEADVGGAVGLATGAVGETFFIRAPQEYHILSTDLPGHPVYLDTTATGLQRMTAADPAAEGTVDREVAEGERPLGEVVELLLDRRGGAAALVIELDEAMRGGEREVAAAMGLVRMLPDPEDPRVTRILLSLDPVDLENAPTFERPDAREGDAAAAEEEEPQAQPMQ